MRRYRLALAILLASTVEAGFAADASSRIDVTPRASKVAAHERIDFDLRIAEQYGNPFDPDEVDVSLAVTAPSGRELFVPAFFAQDYQRRTIERGNKKTDWYYPLGQPGWKVRFSPAEAGRYKAVAKLKVQKEPRTPQRFRST